MRDMEKRKQIEEKIKELLTISASHEIPNIIRSDNLCLKIMWLTYFVISTGICAYYTINSIGDYLKFNTITTLTVINEREPQLPTISFCGFPPF